MALTAQQIGQLEQQLKARRIALVEEIRSELERSGEQHYVDLAGRVADAGDAAVADLLVDVDASMADRDVQELRDIEAALDRIRDGSYGECEGCGGEIEFARLHAYPTATRCIECQRQHEKTFAHANTPRL